MLNDDSRGSCCSCTLQGLTPLQLAARNNAYGALEVLLLQSADVDLQDRRVSIHNSICHCSLNCLALERAHFSKISMNAQDNFPVMHCLACEAV